MGAIVGNIAVNYLGYDSILFYNFIMLAMAGHFTSIVRAPITGAILLVEMTGSFTHLLSLTVVSVVAYIVADLLKSVPIYDSLLENQITDSQTETEEEPDENQKITVEMIVHHGSPAEKSNDQKYRFTPQLSSDCDQAGIKRIYTKRRYRDFGG
jgi:hypothetical protein